LEERGGGRGERSGKGRRTSEIEERSRGKKNRMKSHEEAGQYALAKRVFLKG